MNKEGLIRLRSEGLIHLRPIQKGICVTVEDARKLASIWGQYAETLDKLNKL